MQLLCGVEPYAGAPLDSLGVLSSIHQTAVTLVAVASGLATQRASRTVTPPDCRVETLEPQRADAVRRAAAEQAQRVAACTRAALECVLRLTFQPCFMLDEAGRIVRWNGAMAGWTGIADGDALGHPLSTVFSKESAIEIEAANLALRDSEAISRADDADTVFVLDGLFTLLNGGTAVQISLAPLCRLPGLVETVVVLVTPDSRTQP